MVRDMWKKIKADWDACGTGILIVILVVVVSTILGNRVCVTQRLLGIPCPGCGMTRSFLLVLQGKFAEAWEMHPFVYGWMAFAVIFFIDRYVIRGKEYLWKVAVMLLGVGMLVRYVWMLMSGEVI